MKRKDDSGDLQTGNQLWLLLLLLFVNLISFSKTYAYESPDSKPSVQSERPFIWVTAQERNQILKKIDELP